MVWEASNDNGGFSGGRPWLPVPAAHLARAVARQGDGSLMAHYRAALALRRGQPALRRGAMTPATARGDLLWFERAQGADRLLCAFNLGDGPADIDLPAGHWQAVAQDLGCAPVTGGRASLAPWQAVIARAA
jgi:alpha-glucosidase